MRRTGRRRSGQLGLSFPLSARCHFQSFTVGENAELVRRLEDLDRGSPAFHGYYLFGAPGAGRTHLLQAACHRHGARGRAMYLPLGDPAVTPALLEGLDSRYLVALDDVDTWIGDVDAEQALLGLYQGLHAGGGRLLVSAGAPVGRLEFRLPDLRSRLRALASYQVVAPADADKAEVLMRHARERGLTLKQPVVDFWLRRSTRDLGTLLDELDRLDAAAMAAQRRLTVPFLKDVLGL